MFFCFCLAELYVLVSVSKGAELILSLDLKAEEVSNRGDNSNRSSSNRICWKESRGKTSSGGLANSGKLGRSLGSGLLSLKSGKESNLGPSNLRGINNCGCMMIDWNKGCLSNSNRLLSN